MNERTAESIARSLERIANALEAQAKGGSFAAGSSTPKRSSRSTDGADGDVASDRDLDGKYGNPQIKFDPKEKYWSGESYKGYRFSETTPEYLDAVAKYLEACAHMADRDGTEDGRKKASFKRMDAARARGWARRLRSGWQPADSGGLARDASGNLFDPETGEVGGYDNGDDIPF